MTKRGCPIIDVAPVVSLDRKAVAFLESEQFDTMPAYAKVQEKLLSESGLLDESPQTLIALKNVLREYQEWARKNREAAQQVNGIRRKR